MSDAARKATADDLLARARTLHRAGRLEEALPLFLQALEREPRSAAALNGVGVIALQSGRGGPALEALRKAHAAAPDNPTYAHNLANALVASGQFDEAVTAFSLAVEMAPGDPAPRLGLGMALSNLGRHEEALAAFDAGVAQIPNHAELHVRRGDALVHLERYAQAEAAYAQALAIEPDHARAHVHLGYTILALSRPWDAVGPYVRGFESKRRGGPPDPRLATYRFTSLAKLTHDIEQFRYLERLGLDLGPLRNAATATEDVLRSIDWKAEESFIVELGADAQARLAPFYNRAVHMAPGEALEDGAVNPDLDTEGITRDYFATGPGITFFDDLLRPEALQALRRYCLESTIWYDLSHHGGYMGAYMDDGFFTPLLVQIAEGLRARFPEIIGGHPLRQVWAYKYDSRLSGISTHADFAAVNVNFWITPDSANLDQDSGGLVIYDVEAPGDWDFTEYNNDPPRIHRFLEEHNAGKVVVPYRQNRAVMFNSDLFHVTDRFHFREGYENRRINITMLFGDRQS